MSSMTVNVTGMTCGHCVTSVREEVENISGVTGVNVDLASGKVTIDSEAPIQADAIKDAIEEAGYQLAS
ncbi:heavy-metal-associated domain-containing protein [Mycobacterium sp.]|uniref:heavy-metal-associated domain-containing protein n=1 Tax=Mycobacterium sp. TaxID=1785 RepID=UPI002D935DE4|nr:copper ion binding protein [Mycobacterium sp.]